MAYKPNPNGGLVRDKAYPSEIAAERPALAPRIHCADYPDVDESLRGNGESLVERVNRQLREG